MVVFECVVLQGSVQGERALGRQIMPYIERVKKVTEIIPNVNIFSRARKRRG